MLVYGTDTIMIVFPSWASTSPALHDVSLPTLQHRMVPAPVLLIGASWNQVESQTAVVGKAGA